MYLGQGLGFNDFGYLRLIGFRSELRDVIVPASGIPIDR